MASNSEDVQMKNVPGSSDESDHARHSNIDIEREIEARIRDIENQNMKGSRDAVNIKRKLDVDDAKFGNPSPTLYINNLNDKIRKQELRICLYLLFSTYGHVIDVVALKTPKMRGQAHIVFADSISAAQALKALQGTKFLGKEMHIAYAKLKSNAVAKLDGTFRMPPPPSLNPSTLPEYTDNFKGLKRQREDSEDS
ncbi:hypothetical protein V1511DRAFT_268159 [Dipodascopsis uninucleata]